MDRSEDGIDDIDEDDVVDDDPADEPDEDEDDVPDTPVSIEISGLSLYTHHGVSAAEREVGQRLVLDITLDMLSNDATTTDDVADTVDYGEVCSSRRSSPSSAPTARSSGWPRPSPTGCWTTSTCTR